MNIASIASTATKLALSTGKAIYEYKAADQAERAYEKAAERTSALNDLNERAMQAENAENERRLTAVNARTESLARAKAAASGLALTGSMADYLSFLETENLKELEWTQAAGQSRLAAATASGNLQEQTLKNQAKAAGHGKTGALISGAGETFETGAEAGGWFDQGTAWYRG